MPRRTIFFFSVIFPFFAFFYKNLIENDTCRDNKVVWANPKGSGKTYFEITKTKVLK